ncbi:MAG: twin-arginine translocase subunit TatC [Coriobacteriia bacterium]|nr:twin-arginine translocase subunit TatC [Coriobacteriia bacterium]
MTMPISPKRMPFTAHMNELRKRLSVVVAVVGILTLVGYLYSDKVYLLLVGPMRPVIGDQGSYVFDILEAMSNRFRLGMFAAVVAGSPIIIYEVFAFFLPALKPKERRWFIWTFVAAVLLFLGGVAFCYFFILEPSTAWLVEQSGETFNLMLRAQSAMTFAMWFLAGFGMAFEVPVIVFYLVYFNVVPYATLRKNWRVVWVVIVVVASMITPDWNPWSMAALSAAMVALFEMSMLLVRVMLARKIKAQRLPESE